MHQEQTSKLVMDNQICRVAYDIVTIICKVSIVRGYTSNIGQMHVKNIRNTLPLIIGAQASKTILCCWQ